MSADINCSIFNPLFRFTNALFNFRKIDDDSNPLPEKINCLPQELIAKIFTNLKLTDFLSHSQVNRKWNVQLNELLTTYKTLGKDLVYNDDMTMRPEQFEKHFGNEIIPFNEYSKLAYDSLPERILQILKIKDSSFRKSLFGRPSAKLGETHVLFYIHESFTNSQVCKLFRECFPEYRDVKGWYPWYVDNNYNNPEEIPLRKSGWLLMTTNPNLLGGAYMIYDDSTEAVTSIENLVRSTGQPYEYPGLSAQESYFPSGKIITTFGVIAESLRSNGQVDLVSSGFPRFHTGLLVTVPVESIKV